jgi:hypothetical protein
VQGEVVAGGHCEDGGGLHWRYGLGYDMAALRKARDAEDEREPHSRQEKCGFREAGIGRYGNGAMSVYLCMSLYPVCCEDL